jgi:hypothetical protein
MIDFGVIEIALMKKTVDKNNVDKVAKRKITMVESALLKLFKVDFIASVTEVFIFLLKEIFSHELEFFCKR